MEIRQIEASERQAVSMPVQAYAFQPSPASGELVQRLTSIPGQVIELRFPGAW